MPVSNKTRKRTRGGGGRQRQPPAAVLLPRPEALMAPTTTTTNLTGQVIREGLCERDSCGSEAACKRLSDNRFTCICPHDSSAPTDDLRCPNRNTVEMSPSPIHNIRPPVSNVSMSPPPSSVLHAHVHNTSSVLATLQDPMSQQHLHVMLAVLAVPCLILSLLSLFCCWRHGRRTRGCCGFNGKHRKRSKDNTVPVSLNRGLLASDRYAPNPQYSPFSAGGELAAPLAVPLLNRDRVTFLHDIGEGCFGKVYKVCLGELQTPEGVETVAIKVLKESATTEAEEDFMREVEIMSAFKHENILSLVGVSLREADRPPWMVFEFMPHGDLTEVLRSNSRSFWAPDAASPRLDKESLLNIARQIANGMAYLAGQRFVHRDLACRNCLVGDNLAVKIADFGMSRDVYTCDYYKIGGSRMLPVRWMSPESVIYGRFTLESDVWSFGVVLWEIYSLGKQPYYGHSNEEVVRLILQGIMLIPPEDCPLFVCELMRTCWKTEPRDRTNFAQIQQTLRYAPTAPLMTTTLPRPPAFPVTPLLAVEVMDDDNYLKPLPSEPKEYLQTLPD